MSNKSRKGEAPPRYDEAFREGAVRMVVEQHHPARQVATALGICIDTLKSWLKRAGHVTSTSAMTRPDRVKELEAENRALKKELAEKSEAVEILKKSLGILSK
ncbi:MAG: transposase, partial [Oscillospiraceae bacterium]